MALTKVLITVKTYPSLSIKYKELVCTAGFREDGTFIRIYPIQFRKKSYDEQYRKYDWIELELVDNHRDFRPESFRPKSHDSGIKIVGHTGTNKGYWYERKEICLKNVYDNLSELIGEAKDKNTNTSLAVFKPTEIIDFTTESTDREWDSNKLEALKQMNIFEMTSHGEFKVVQKLPYKFKYTFKDIQGTESKMMIEDWEIGQLYWNCLARHEGDEKSAIADVRKKYFDDFAKTKDLYFFLGTTQAFHHRSKNPFIIIGTFHPKKETQIRMNFD